MRRGGNGARAEFPLQAKIYVAALACIAFISGALWRLPNLLHDRQYQASLALLTVLALLSWRIRERDIGGKVSLAFSSIVLLASIVLVLPEGAGLIGLIAPLAALGSEPLGFTVFNAVMVSSVSSLAGRAYGMACGPPLSQLEGHQSGALPAMMIALIVADLLQCVGNAVIVSGMYKFHRGRPFRRELLGILRSSGLVYVGYGVIGIIFVLIWASAEVRYFSAVLVLAPLLVAQWSFSQYGDERRSHERTLNALVTAMETKDQYTRGHSERVAELCELMARHLSLSAQRSEELRYAGLLHDIGKLGLPTRLLRRPAPLVDDDLVHLSAHAHIGADMIADIEFLEEALEGVRHHHERWDGGGYPGRLSGDAIPEFARIIAVADAFDTMTTDRGDRPAYPVAAALRELHDAAGTQFDPSMVEALEQALQRRDWQITDVVASRQRPGDPPYDHDCPQSSAELAARPDILDRIQSAITGPAAGSAGYEARVTVP